MTACIRCAIGPMQGSQIDVRSYLARLLADLLGSPTLPIVTTVRMTSERLAKPGQFHNRDRPRDSGRSASLGISTCVEPA